MKFTENKSKAAMYSEKEKEMIEALGFSDLMECMEPLVLYKCMTEGTFVENKQGPAADSLRRTVKALRDFEIHRMTKEFDDLIQL